MINCKKTKILLCGQFFEHSLESSYYRAFVELGAKVKKFKIFDHSPINIFFDKDRLNKFFSSYTFRKILSDKYNKEITNKLKKIDMDICFFFDLTYIYPETIQFLRKRKIKTICFLPDNPLKGFLNYRPEVINSIRELDIYLCWGTKILKELKQNSYKNAVFHTFAWDSIRNKKFKIKKNLFLNDIVFVGNWDKDREKLIDSISENFLVKIWGENDWLHKTKSKQIKKIYTGKSAYNQKFSNICFNSFLNLNILRQQNLKGGGLNMRSFEILGEKGLILQNYGPDAKKIFGNYSRYLMFKDQNDIVKKINFMKENKSFFKNVKLDLFNNIKKNHSYLERSKKILQLL